MSPLQEPDFRNDDAVFNYWKHDQLANAKNVLIDSRNSSHHILASRALVRARLREWDDAIADAKEVFAAHLSYKLTLIPTYIESIAIQPSLMESVSPVGNGKKLEAYRACDIAFEHCHSTYVSFLLLIKVCILVPGPSSAAHVSQAIVVCMAGEYDDAISRVKDLIASLHLNPICHVVEARA